MESKKNEKYQLEHKRPLFFGIGMVISLALTLVAFEWKSEVEPVVVYEPEDEIIWTIVEEPKITKHDITEMPKPKSEKKKIISPVVTIKEVKELADTFDDEKSIVDIDDEITDILLDEPIKIEVPEDPFIVVEDMPEFPGGDEALLKFVAQNIKYPRRAKNMGIEGRVYLKFVIDEDGSITNIEVLKGIGAGCDEEAIRVLKLLPNFTPGKQRGVPVKVQMQLPINFTLQ